MVRRRGRPPEGAPLAAPLETLGADIRTWLRARFPDLPPDVPLVWREGRHHCSHRVGVIQTATTPPRGVFVKGPARTDLRRLPQNFALEQWVLAHIGPRIARRNPAIGCPALIASAPAHETRVLELIEGPTLDALLFGLRRDRRRRDLPALIRLTGEWLGHFHALTRGEAASNPLDWVLTDLEAPERRAALRQHAGRTRHDALRRLAEVFRRRYAAVSRQRCLVHHMFTAWHVLVSEGRLLVIDFATSREGYAHEDLGLFLALDDVRAPWRRWLGRLRLSPGARAQAFLDGYQSVVGPLRPFDRVVLRFARVLAAVRYTTSAFYGRESWSRAIKARGGAPWLRLRLRDVCDRELAALRALASTPEEPGEAR